MTNGIIKQLEGLQREIHNLDQLLSKDKNWRTYQDICAIHPDRSEKDLIQDIILPESLANSLRNNQLFQARLKILDAINILTSLISKTKINSDVTAKTKFLNPLENSKAPHDKKLQQLTSDEECISAISTSQANAKFTEFAGYSEYGEEARTEKNKIRKILNSEKSTERADSSFKAEPNKIRTASIDPSPSCNDLGPFEPQATPKISNRASIHQRDFDDLTQIKGIDAEIALQLRKQGVQTFAEIAGWTSAQLIVVSSILGFGTIPRKQDWIGQATRLCQADSSLLSTEEPKFVLIETDKVLEKSGNLVRNKAHSAIASPSPDSDKLISRILLRLALGSTCAVMQNLASSQVMLHRCKTVSGNSPKKNIENTVETPQIPTPHVMLSDELKSNSTTTEERCFSETAANDDQPDNLHRIKNITDTDVVALADLGIASFTALATLSAHDAKYLRASLTNGKRLHKEQWIEQAAILAQGRLTHFARQQSHNLISSTSAIAAEEANMAELSTKVETAESKTIFSVHSIDTEIKAGSASVQLPSIKDQEVLFAKRDHKKDDQDTITTLQDVRVEAQNKGVSISSATITHADDAETRLVDEESLALAKQRQANLNKRLDRLQRRISAICISNTQQSTSTLSPILNDTALPIDQANNDPPTSSEISRQLKLTSEPKEPSVAPQDELVKTSQNQASSIDGSHKDVGDEDTGHKDTGQKDTDNNPLEPSKTQIQTFSSSDNLEASSEQSIQIEKNASVVIDHTNTEISRSSYDLTRRMKRLALDNDSEDEDNSTSIARFAFDAEEASVHIIRHRISEKISEQNDHAPSAHKQATDLSNSTKLKSPARHFLRALTGRKKKT